MICFDLMFEEPQLSLYVEHGIRDFLWSSYWVNKPPVITGTQVELARSLSLPSNFLASGIGLSWEQSGSGIYSYGNPLVHWYNFGTTPLSKMLIADVPKFQAIDYYYKKSATFEHSQLDFTPTSKPTPPTIVTFSVNPGDNITISSTSNNLTCTTSLIVSDNSSEDDLFGIYSLDGIYNGLFPAQICGVIKCLDKECTASTLDTYSKFDFFEISGNFNMDKIFMMYPLVAKNHSMIVSTDLYNTNSPRFPTKITSKLIAEYLDLLNAVLFGLEYHDPS